MEPVGHTSCSHSSPLVCGSEESSSSQMSQLVSSQPHLQQVTANIAQGDSFQKVRPQTGPQSGISVQQHLSLGSREMSSSVCSQKQFRANTFRLPKNQSPLGEAVGVNSSSSKVRAHQNLSDVHPYSGTSFARKNMLAQSLDSQKGKEFWSDDKQAKLQASASVYSPSSMVSDPRKQTAQSSSAFSEGFSDSTTWKSPINSIGWQDQAYRQLLFIKEKYQEDMRLAYQKTQELCTRLSNEKERAESERIGVAICKIFTFLCMQRSDLAYYSKEKFHHNISFIMALFNKIGLRYASAAQDSQFSQTSNQLNTRKQHQLGEVNIQVNTSRQDSRSMHVGRHHLQRQDIRPSYSEARPINSFQTGIRVTNSSFCNVLQPGLTSGQKHTKNKPHLAKMGILPIFNAQGNFQQEAISPFPQLSGMNKVQNCFSTQMQVDSSSRSMDCASNSILTCLPSISTPILSPSNSQQEKHPMMQPQKVMPHQLQRFDHNNQQKIRTSGTKRSKLERAAGRQQNHPIGHNRQSSPSSQKALPNFSRHYFSSAPASNNSPQSVNSVHFLSKGASDPSQATASQATAPSALPTSTSTSFTSQCHVNSISPEVKCAHKRNTNSPSNALKENDALNGSDSMQPGLVPSPALVAKRPKIEFAEFLFQEIEVINRRLIETVVDIIHRMTDVTHGTEGAILQFTYTAVGQKQSPCQVHYPSIMLPNLLLRVVVWADYPNLSPVIIDRNPVPWSDNAQATALWNEACQKFERALRTLAQPISVGQMAKAWDVSAHDTCHEYAKKLGGGSFSSKYGSWENYTVT